MVVRFSGQPEFPISVFSLSQKNDPKTESPDSTFYDSFKLKYFQVKLKVLGEMFIIMLFI